MFPAPAGINRSFEQYYLNRKGVPRASGDKPKSAAAAKSFACVFPAPAGINRLYPLPRLQKVGVPRASGDKPCARFFFIRSFGCSPRQRG